MEQAEIIKTKSTSVLCSGKDVPYDHPKVFLEIDPALAKIICPYCSKEFHLQT